MVEISISKQTMIRTKKGGNNNNNLGYLPVTADISAFRV